MTCGEAKGILYKEKMKLGEFPDLLLLGRLGEGTTGRKEVVTRVIVQHVGPTTLGCRKSSAC